MRVEIIKKISMLNEEIEYNKQQLLESFQFSDELKADNIFIKELKGDIKELKFSIRVLKRKKQVFQSLLDEMINLN
jgi:hypothetical protein